MELLFILIVVSSISAVISRIKSGNWNLKFAGNLAMFLMLCFTALGHILFVRGMSMMIPPFIPFKIAMVYITGLVEIILGLALLFPSFRRLAGMSLIVFFILILPANIYQALHHIDLQKGDFSGKGPEYLWFRIPLQFFLISWVWYFSIHERSVSTKPTGKMSRRFFGYNL